MIIIWKGKGWLVPLAAMLGFCVSASVAFSAAVALGLGIAPPLAISLLGAAGATYTLTRWITRRDETRELLDPITGEVSSFRPKHSLYFIPVAAWPYIIAATAVVPFFVEALNVA